MTRIESETLLMHTSDQKHTEPTKTTNTGDDLVVGLVAGSDCFLKVHEPWVWIRIDSIITQVASHHNIIWSLNGVGVETFTTNNLLFIK